MYLMYVPDMNHSSKTDSYEVITLQNWNTANIALLTQSSLLSVPLDSWSGVIVILNFGFIILVSKIILLSYMEVSLKYCLFCYFACIVSVDNIFDQYIPKMYPCIARFVYFYDYKIFH